jgi:hypothetical protein
MPFDADDARSLPGLTFAFDRAYEACPPHVRCLPSRKQSPEILRLAAIACTMLPWPDDDDTGEGRTIRALADLARHPVELEACIVAMHRDCADDDFPAARLDPLARRGWCPLEQKVRFPKVSPWQRDMSDLITELRAGTFDLDGEVLHARLKDNIRANPASYAMPYNPEANAKACDMMPVTAAAFYVMCFERGVRELEQGLEQRDRCIRDLENRIYELEAQCEARA